MSESQSKSRCRSARWWLAPRLTFESQPNWYLFYKYKKSLLQKQNLYVDKSSQTNIFTIGFVCLNISCCEQGVSLLLSPSWINILAHPWTTVLLSWIQDVTIVAIDSEWKNVTQTKQRRDMRLASWLTSRLNRQSMIFLCAWIQLDLDPGLVPSETRYGSKPSFKSSLKSRLLVNMAPGIRGCPKSQVVPVPRISGISYAITCSNTVPGNPGSQVNLESGITWDFDLGFVQENPRISQEISGLSGRGGSKWGWVWQYNSSEDPVPIDFIYGCLKFNSLGPSDAIWHWRSWSTLVQVMACCLMAPSHYLNQCWLIISKVLWHSSEDIIIKRFEDTNQ